MKNCMGVHDMIELKDAGLNIAVVGFFISLVGVIENNLLLDHIAAMLWWVPSNALFCLYFLGRTRGWWDGHIGDGVMCVNYAFMLVSGIVGLWQSGVL
jgi:hypothetical protein